MTIDFPLLFLLSFFRTGRRPLQAGGHDRTANRTMVAIPKGPRQTIDASQILRELVALHLLHVQLCIRLVRAVGQAMVLGREKLLVRLSTSGELSADTNRFRYWRFPWFFMILLEFSMICHDLSQSVRIFHNSRTCSFHVPRRFNQPSPWTVTFGRITCSPWPSTGR